MERGIYLRAIKWIAWGLLLCVLAALAIGYGVGWYYGHRLLPANVQSGANITASKAYQEAAAQILSRAQKKIAAAKDEHERWLALKDLAFFTVDTNKPAEARAYAKELIALAPKYRNDANYGDALHIAHIALGRIALQNNDIPEANRELLEAGRTPGSPQLESLGPNMLLAKELLEKGQKDIVIEYIGLCGKFWKSDKVKLWQDTIKEGGIPDFGSNLLKV